MMNVAGSNLPLVSIAMVSQKSPSHHRAEGLGIIRPKDLKSSGSAPHRRERPMNFGTAFRAI